MNIEPRKDFMCSCRPKGKRRCEEVLEQVMKELCDDQELPRSEFITQMVYSLEWKLDHCRANIASIACDMWARVDVKVYGGEYLEDDDDKDWEVETTISVQCDKIEHGLARVWQLANEIDEEIGNKLKDEN